ncbi:Tn7 transposase TnsA N-terminal domain-containing protein, partial [Hydrogenimonas sp.]
MSILEFNDAVLDVVEQPFTIEYTNANGMEALYTPDFLVDFRLTGSGRRFVHPDREVPCPKPLLIEVKPRAMLKKKFAELRPKFKAAMAYAAANDMIFKIYDESRIHGPYFDNVKFLRRYRRYRYDRVEEERLIGMIEALGHCPIDMLLVSLYATEEQKGMALGHVYHLLATKK